MKEYAILTLLVEDWYTHLINQLQNCLHIYTMHSCVNTFPSELVEQANLDGNLLQLRM